MKSRDEIITGMCLTWDHSYLAPQQEIFPGHVFGLTDEQKRHLRSNMTQVFDNDIAPLLEDYEDILVGEQVVLPVSIKHAEAMLMVAENYLKGKQ